MQFPRAFPAQCARTFPADDDPIAAMFPAGKLGVSVEPYLRHTLSQDTAGATPVTAAGDPVGMAFSRYGGGYHPVQAVALAKPLYVVTNGVPELEADGSNDFMLTPAIPWATDEVTIIAAVRKMSDTTIGMVCEFSASTDSNPGTFFLAAPRDGNTANYGFRSAGTVIRQANSAAAYAAPRRDIIVAQGKIGSDICTIRVNGGSPVTVAADQGSGVFGTYGLYLFMRGGTTLAAKVGLGGFFCANWFPPTAVVDRAARYLAAKTGVTYA